MVKFEQILIDPSPGEVAECLALAAAAADAGARERKLGDQPAKWRKMARECGAGREGVLFELAGHGSFPASSVKASWWTDALGRKHAAVRGERFDASHDRVVADPGTLRRRPPLWHCYPETTFGVVAGGVESWLVACRCGILGTPESVAWTGTLCGPCFDRVLDGSQATGEQAVFWAEAVPSCLGFVKRTLLFGDKDGRVYGIADGAARGDYRYTLPEHAAAGSVLSAGDVIYVSGADEFFNEMSLFSATGGYLRPVAAGVTAVGGRDRVYFTQRNCETVYDTDGRRVLEDDRVTRFCSLDASREWLLATDGQSLFGCCLAKRPQLWALELLETEDGRGRGHPHGPVRLALPASGTAGYAAYGGAVCRVDMTDGFATRILPADDPAYRAAGLVPPDSLTRTGFGVTADGKYLAAVADNDRLVVYHAAALKPLATLFWHLGDITALAVHPTKNLIATAGVEGAIKLWDLDRLLPAVAPP